MTELDTYQLNAAQRARTASLRELLVSLDTYARDIEAEGRTMAPAFIREAVKRLEADAQALADVRTLDEWAIMPRGDKCHESWTMRDNTSGNKAWACCLSGDGGQIFYGPTAEGARANAALWVRESWPNLCEGR